MSGSVRFTLSSKFDPVELNFFVVETNEHRTGVFAESNGIHRSAVLNIDMRALTNWQLLENR